MKKLTLSFWLALAAAGIFAIQAAAPKSHNIQTDLPLPTCPPYCPLH
jgi:hypothetical protein